MLELMSQSISIKPARTDSGLWNMLHVAVADGNAPTDESEAALSGESSLHQCCKGLY